MDARNPKIADSQLSASSEKTSLKLFARFGRMWTPRTNTHSYAWCAAAGGDQWLQVDFGKLVLVNGVIVQGSILLACCHEPMSYFYKIEKN